MEKPKLLILEPDGFNPEAILLLKESFEVTLAPENLVDPSELALGDFEVIFIRLRYFIGSKILEKASKLRYILTATTGLDHIDVPMFEKSGGTVVSLKGETAFLDSIPSTAEHSWGLLLALYRNIPQAFEHVRSGFWSRDLFRGRNLKGKKLGILGLGRVGRQMATFAGAFDMEVGYFDIGKIDPRYQQFSAATDLASWCDILSVHIPLEPQTTGLVGKEILDALHEEAVVVNTSRGAVIDETALTDALLNGKIAGYATDVLTNEVNGIQDNPLVRLSQEMTNIIITPHIAGATIESMHATEIFIVRKLLSLR